jgi:hydroxymethylglutaryl-CoA reductase
MEILGHPGAEKLMMIIAAAGLANNFSAVRSLVTTGIQAGHMKMHLGNILRQLDASPSEAEKAREYFRDRTISYADVAAFLSTLKGQNPQQ